MKLWAQEAVRDALSVLGGVGTAMGSDALSIIPAPWLSSKAGAALDKSLVPGGGAGTSLPSPSALGSSRSHSSHGSATRKLICRVKGLVSKRETGIFLTFALPSCRNPIIIPLLYVRVSPAKAFLLSSWQGRKILVPPFASLLHLLPERNELQWLELVACSFPLLHCFPLIWVAFPHQLHFHCSLTGGLWCSVHSGDSLMGVVFFQPL